MNAGVIVRDGAGARRELRHALMRRRNERIAADQHADGMPVALVMAPTTREELLLDNDPAEAFAIDFEGREFLGIPLLEVDTLEHGVVEVRWP